MSAAFSSGKNAFGICDVCGFRCKLSKMKKRVEKGVVTEVKCCPTCWDPDHPQLRIGEVRTIDPQSLRDPRPDSIEWEQSRAMTYPVVGARGRGEVGYVTVVIA